MQAGVHRVQRVPITDGAGKVQTSTATVAVMPEVIPLLYCTVLYCTALNYYGTTRTLQME